MAVGEETFDDDSSELANALARDGTPPCDPNAEATPPSITNSAIPDVPTFAHETGEPDAACFPARTFPACLACRGGLGGLT